MPAIVVIDTFSNSYGYYTISYTHTFDGLTVDFEDSSHHAAEPELSLFFSPSERGGRNAGDTIFTATYGSDIVEIKAELEYPYATVYHSTAGGGSGPGCDLLISSVTTTNETSAGAANGTATIHATSSVPIQYSLDGITWTSGNIFTGLAGGTYTAQCIDSNTCSGSFDFTVSTTPATPPPPYSLVDTPVYNNSRWSALFNPVVFKYHGAPGTKFRTEITSGYDGATNVMTADHTADLSGNCRADISKYLRILLKPRDDHNYTAINYRDANISASYTLRFCAVTRDAGNNEVLGPWVSAGNPFYVTYSAMQIGNPTGGNMQPYVTLPTAGQTHPAKFLNDFKNPRFYTDMPFDLSFIYSELIAGYQIKLGGNGIDINGNISGALGELMLLNENGSVLLNNDGSKLLIEKQTPGVLYNKLGLNRLRITQNIPANSIWLDIFLFYTNTSGANIQITEARRLLLDNSPCNGLPYEYLKWIGPTGGWMYYMFIKNQLHEIATNNSVITETYISDYATADGTQQQVSINAQKSITAGVNDVSIDEAEALSTLMYSPKVYRLVNKELNIWQAVIIDTKSLKMYQTSGGIGDFEIRFLLPEINTQRA
ncbi:hypothetical protein KXQ82_09030 [Mucilaginibacter sp. HMF5004]|uniref:hypothetical protein n=1 Tax=Mucilaginibacter rivuli TaxID=2857527 RepID=UPI001C5EB00A|nr:hypothetical protein [Mucilaginibacter rivuli]MBW4889858.1 hypothetical protein [Mucilaginibacter rivuli]